MTAAVDIQFYYNFRSPYCYLVSKSVWDIFDDYRANLVWRPLGGWSGRSDPDRAKVKIPLVRQDVKRWCRKLGIPFVPPPITTESTLAGAGSLLAEREGLLRPYIVEVMRAEWAEGRDIGQVDVLRDVAATVGLDSDALIAATEDPENLATLDRYAAEAQEKGVFGVPSFVIGDEVFWGNDRLDFIRDHLRELGLRNV